MVNNRTLSKNRALAAIAEKEQADIEQLQQLHLAYRHVLAGKDRQLALTAGRAYYTFIRQGQ